MQPLPSNLGGLTYVCGCRHFLYWIVRLLNAGQLDLFHSSTASPCVWQQSPNIFCYNHRKLGCPLVPFPHHCPRPGRIFSFCPWLVALHEATVSTPHLLPATRIVSVISFHSVRPISELLQPVPHPSSCVVFTSVFTRSCLVILLADERLLWSWGKAWAHVLWLEDVLRLDTIRGTALFLRS